MAIEINHQTNDISATGVGSVTIDGAAVGGGGVRRDEHRGDGRAAARQPPQLDAHAVARRLRLDGIESLHFVLAVRDDEGKVRRIAGIAEDITERKRAEVALQEAYNIINRSPGTGRPPLSKIC